jgi:hypothetical protein
MGVSAAAERTAFPIAAAAELGDQVGGGQHGAGDRGGGRTHAPGRRRAARRRAIWSSALAFPYDAVVSTSKVAKGKGKARTPTKSKARTPKPDTHTTTMAWHQPKCNACKEPIVDMHDALAVCLMDRKNQSHSPMLLHVGVCFQRLRATHDVSHSIHVDAYRRTPLEAIIVAMRRRASTEAERIVWHSWLNVVLGLPVGDETNLWPGGESASHVLDHVLTIDEARRITGETSSAPP